MEEMRGLEKAGDIPRGATRESWVVRWAWLGYHRGGG